MSPIRSLDITGYRNEPVPNTFLQQTERASHIAIVFPGVQYTCQMPLLYYTSSLLFNLGADVLCVEYDYSRSNDFQILQQDDGNRRFIADVMGASNAALSFRTYRDVTLVGKSLGTLAIAQLLADPQHAHSRAIWLTPLLKDERVRASLRKGVQRSLVAVGTHDSHYDADFLEELATVPSVRTVVFEAADHSLEVKGELLRSLGIMERLIGEIEVFMTH